MDDFDKDKKPENLDSANDFPQSTDSSTPMNDSSLDVESLKKSYEDEISKLQESYTRLLAELVNTRKNFDLDKDKSKQSLLLKIISIVDTYSIIAENEQASDTVNHILVELNTLLQTESVKKLEIKSGDKFDHNIEEVISTQPGDEDGIILTVVSPAWEKNGQIIKTAKVIVSKK